MTGTIWVVVTVARGATRLPSTKRGVENAEQDAVLLARPEPAGCGWANTENFVGGSPHKGGKEPGNEDAWGQFNKESASCAFFYNCRVRM